MTDFLSGLVDRALDRTPGVLRRNRSRFEPAPEIPVLRAPWFSNSWLRPVEVETEEIVTPQIRETPPRRIHPRQRNREIPQNERPEVARAENQAVAAPSNPRSPLPSKQDSHQPAQVTPPRKERVVIDKVVTTTQRGKILAKQVSERREQSALAGQTKPVDKNPATVAAQPPSVKAMAAQALIDGPKPKESFGLQSKRRTEPPRVPIAPAKSSPQSIRATPRVSPQLPIPPAVRRESQVAPTPIHVTIGRIEVRAAAPARAPSRAPRSASPKLNLQEYLRSRGGDAQ